METVEFTSSSVFDTLNSHVSIRHYTDQPIDRELLYKIINAARRSPTSSNLQAYSFIIVQNQKTRNELAVLAGNQKHIETCGAFIAICADIHRLETAAQMHEKQIARNLENSMVSIVDAALAGMSLSTAAESFGLGTVMIGGMRNHPVEVAELLNLPSGVFVVFGLCIGWPEITKIRTQKPRLQAEAVIHEEVYSDDNLPEKIQNYDQNLRDHYLSQGRQTPEAAWSGIIAKRFSNGRRPELRSTLESMGFSFD